MSGASADAGAGSPPDGTSTEASAPWGERTRAHGLLAALLLWATRVAAVAFVLDIVDRRLHVVGWGGAGVLLAAPLVAMLVASVQYARERDWREAGLAFLLLLMLVAGAWLGRA